MKLHRALHSSLLPLHRAPYPSSPSSSPAPHHAHSPSFPSIFFFPISTHAHACLSLLSSSSALTAPPLPVLVAVHSTRLPCCNFPCAMESPSVASEQGCHVVPAAPCPDNTMDAIRPASMEVVPVAPSWESGIRKLYFTVSPGVDGHGILTGV